MTEEQFKVINDKLDEIRKALGIGQNEIANPFGGSGTGVEGEHNRTDEDPPLE